MRFPLASLLAAAVALAFAAGAARAEESAGYAGLSIGMVSVPMADDIFTGTDTSLITGNVYLGGRFNEFVGFEAGYLKSTEGEISNNAGDDLGNYDVDVLHGALVGRIPTGGGITPFAKIGLHRWKLRGGAQVIVGQDRTFTGTDLMFGAGIDWMAGESWDVRVEYMHLPYDDDVIGEDKLHAFLIGVHRRF